jgi:type VI protein secretion system component VasK
MAEFEYILDVHHRKQRLANSVFNLCLDAVVFIAVFIVVWWGKHHRQGEKGVFDLSSFIAGIGMAAFVCAFIHWITVSRMRRDDVAWRQEQRKRIDELAARADRQYDQSRKDLGLPPRRVS